MAEDAEAAAEESVPDAVPLDVLRREEADQRLRRREPHEPTLRAQHLELVLQLGQLGAAGHQPHQLLPVDLASS